LLDEIFERHRQHDPVTKIRAAEKKERRAKDKRENQPFFAAR
jgi:hypothetical protein